MPVSSRRKNQRGVSMYFGALSFFMIVPIVGLTIDVGFLYAVKARLQASVDGASLAAARALNLGQTTAAQTTAAKTNAVNWFYANYPLGAWGSYGTQMDAGNVQVFDDPNNPRVRNVTVSASTNVKTYFLGWLRVSSSLVRAQGNASRRDVVVMIVLDRSGSMGAACDTMKSAAKLFTGQFAAGRDRIGLVSFSDNVHRHSAPTLDFQNTLGYTNSSGTGSGMLDTISCEGGTATAQAISVAYNELYKVNLPGALNVIMFETDGLPNTLTLNFWDSANNVAGISPTSTCKDASPIPKTKGAGGFATAGSLPSWTAGQALGAGGWFADIPAGIVGSVYADDPGVQNKVRLMWKYWSTSTPPTFVNHENLTSATAPGCYFTNTSYQIVNFPPSDLAWFPLKDVWGNNLTSTNYKTVTTSGGHVQHNSWANYRNAAFNATDAAAYQARSNPNLPVHFFGIGLGGGTNPPDYVLMQRLANDPRGDNYNKPPRYSPCSQSPGCVTYSDQPQGTFIFSANPASLSQAFLSISSEVLRLSK